MSTLIQFGVALRAVASKKHSSQAPFLFLNQTRSATKRVSGSKTNKNDSAGRRLGPKAFENNFVKPGQIIMRQRGTKIHPGENVGIGRDYTIFALEPGYVRFYLDPFHPMRKYVGVALKSDMSLPKPHFDPRVRRFGYKLLKGKAAELEVNRMSRKETLLSPELKRMEEERKQRVEVQAAEYASFIKQIDPDLTPEQVDLGASRLLFIAQKLAFGEAYEYAQEQATFNAIYDLELLKRTGSITENELVSKKQEYIAFADKFDLTVAVDFAGAVHPTYDGEALSKKCKEVIEQLDAYKNKVIKKADKLAIEHLISEPGLFTKKERQSLTKEYLPEMLPETVPGTVLKLDANKRVPRNAVKIKTFDPKTRKVTTVLRSKDAFPQHSAQ